MHLVEDVFVHATETSAALERGLIIMYQELQTAVGRHTERPYVHEMPVPATKNDPMVN